jgi:ABC-2 type transport system ATP-binding protein
MLTLQNFSKHYGDALALTIPSLQLDPGIYWIKGENGSGKTTLFRSLTGLLPCEGQVTFNGNISLKDTPLAYRRLVNYSEAEPLYPDFLTPKELVRFIGQAKGASREQQDQLSARFGIDQFFDKPCGACSSGMLKKVSLTLAFLGAPKVIILDEPLITLDEAARRILFTLIQQYNEKQDVIFLLSSHQLLEDAQLLLKGIFTIRDKTIHPA